MIGCFFFFKGRQVFNLGGAYKWEGGVLISSRLQYLCFNRQSKCMSLSFL